MLNFKLVKLAVLLLSVVDAPSTSVHAIVGDDVVLPVQLETKLDTSHLKVSWKRNEVVVHTFRDGRDYLENQNENFKGRTSMFEDEIAEGNVSLRLKKVTEEDSGTYNCTVTNNNKDYHNVSLSVELRARTNESRNGTTNKNQSGGLSAGGIGGIVVGCIVVVCIVGLICVFLYKQRSFCRNNRNNRNRGQPGANREGGNPLPEVEDQNELVPIHHPNQGQPGADGEGELDELNARQDQDQNDD